MTQTVIASKATVYRVNGKGRGWRSKSAAYRHAALAMLRAACDCHYDHEYGMGTVTEHHVCRLCNRTCEQHRSLRHTEYRYDAYAQEEGCESDHTHSYRYRLVARLARWLMWRDSKAVACSHEGIGLPMCPTCDPRTVEEGGPRKGKSC
jgi:hypothetical protein